MKKTALSISLMISISILLAIAFTKPSKAATEDVQMIQPEETLSTQSELSCANPTKDMTAACQAMEQEILASTVRLNMYSPLMYVEGSGMRILTGMGHATIKDGRYLVTHNHYDETLFSILQQGDPENLIILDIFDTDGEFIMQVPGQTLTVLILDTETVVFDFGQKDGLDFFTAHDLPSVNFLSEASMPIQPGMEVAQIDWDGLSTHIDWVTVEEITTRSETPIVKLSNCIKLGASGGGVFWQGNHIGNNWSRTATCGEGTTSEGIQLSTVALNAQLVITAGS